MTHVTYRIVRHDEGWAYKAGDVFSEPFRTHAAALAAAKRAAQEQRVPGQTHVRVRGRERPMAYGNGGRKRPPGHRRQGRQSLTRR